MLEWCDLVCGFPHFKTPQPQDKLPLATRMNWSLSCSDMFAVPQWRESQRCFFWWINLLCKSSNKFINVTANDCWECFSPLSSYFVLSKTCVFLLQLRLGFFEKSYRFSVSLNRLNLSVAHPDDRWMLPGDGRPADSGGERQTSRVTRE